MEMFSDTERINPMTIARARRITSIAWIAAIVGGMVIFVAGCGTTPTQQASLTAGAATLTAVAAAHNTTVASLVGRGALFCQKAAADAPLVVAVANLSGVPVSVTNASAEVVAGVCAGIEAVPVPAPADPASTPVVMAPVALPAAKV
jgi:hypothetical protein